MGLMAELKKFLSPPPPPTGVTHLTPVPKPPTFEQISARFKNRAEVVGTPENKIDLSFAAPPLINVMADLHVGHPSVHYDRIESEVKAIVAKANSYVMLAGDIVDNMHWNPGQMEQAEQTPAQVTYARTLLQVLGDAGKLLVSIKGDHDGWLGKAGMDLDAEVAAAGGHPTNGPTMITAKVGKQTYNIFAAHRLPGHSMYNRTHPQMRAERFGGARGADVIVSGHNHQKGIATDHAKQWPGKAHPVNYIALGSYKPTDGYLQKKGYLPQDAAEMYGVTIQLSGKEHKVIVHPDILKANKK